MDKTVKVGDTVTPSKFGRHRLRKITFDVNDTGTVHEILKDTVKVLFTKRDMITELPKKWVKKYGKH